VKFVVIEKTRQPVRSSGPQTRSHYQSAFLKQSRHCAFAFWAVATTRFLSMVPIPVDVDALSIDPFCLHLKQARASRSLTCFRCCTTSRRPNILSQRCAGPRTLILAPTHELSRQLASFRKALVHHSRLRVQSASRANVARTRLSATKMTHALGGDDVQACSRRALGKDKPYLDVLVATPGLPRY
jgi:hypothetical protein